MTAQFPHICFVAPNAYPLLSGNEEIEVIGGAELQVVIVAKLLAARGRRVSMICLDFGQPERTEIEGVTVLRAYRPHDGIPVLRFIWPRLIGIWKCLKRADADIYYHQTAGRLTGIMAAYCKFRKRKCVFASASNLDLVPESPRIPFAKDRWIFAYGLKRVDQVFVQNDEQAQLCRTHLGREPVLVRNCYSKPPASAIDDGDRFILWVSTIRGLKRPELFLDLAQAMPNVRFRMIGGPGDGEAELYEAIRARANTIDNVRFLGFVPFSRTEAHFDRALLVVNTSESEGFPNTFLQAWARRIPTISFVDAGARLDNQPIGVQVNSFEEMVAKVNWFLTHDADRALEGDRCARYVDRNHSPDEIVKLYEQIFEELMNSGSTAVAQPGRDRGAGECGNRPT